jgi:hypothetical protein
MRTFRFSPSQVDLLLTERPTFERTDTNLPLHANAVISAIMLVSQCIVVLRFGFRSRLQKLKEQWTYLALLPTTSFSTHSFSAITLQMMQ